MTLKAESKDWPALDYRYLQHPYSLGREAEPKILERGKGCTLWDTDGREYLDMAGGAWLAPRCPPPR